MLQEAALQQNRAAGWRRALPWAALAIFVLGLAVCGFAMWLAGGSPVGLFVYPLAFALFILLPGLWLCGQLLPVASAGESCVLAVPLGAVVLMLSFTLLGWFLPPGLVGVPSLVLAVLHLAKVAKQYKAPQRPSLADITPAFWWLLALCGVGLGLYAACGVMPMADALMAGNMVYNQDALWAVGNAASAQWGMPVRDIRTAGGVMHYHYMADVLCGLLALFSGQSTWDAVAFFNWPLWFITLGAGLYFVARRFEAGPLAALLAPVGALLCHGGWDVSFVHIFANPNGVLQSYAFLTAALLALQIAEANVFKNRRALAAFGVALAALLWSKSTTGILLVCAVLAAWAVGFFLRRKMSGWMLAAGLTGAGIIALLYAFLYSGAINNLVFRPTWYAAGDAVRILVHGYLPTVVLYGVSLAFSLRELKRLSYVGLLVNALVPGGILSYILFYHYSFSQSYFLLVACFAMWLCIARVAGRLLQPGWLRISTAVLCALGVALAFVQAWPTLWRGAQTAVRCMGLRPSYEKQVDTVTPDDAAVARWLVENLGENEIFATNRNAQNPDAGEGVFHYYTAASGRQAYVESWRYAMDYSMEYSVLRHNLEQVSDAIFKAESFEEAQKLAAQHNIGYLVVHLSSGGHAFNGVEPEFSSDTVLIYKI